MMNNKGPNTLPWGTPDGTGAQSDWEPFNTTRCFLSLSQDYIQLNMSPVMLCARSLARRRICGTRSNAFEKSRYNTSMSCPLSRREVSVSKYSSRLVRQDRCETKPCCEEFSKFWSERCFTTSSHINDSRILYIQQMLNWSVCSQCSTAFFEDGGDMCKFPVIGYFTCTQRLVKDDS